MKFLPINPLNLLTSRLQPPLETLPEESQVTNLKTKPLTLGPRGFKLFSAGGLGGLLLSSSCPLPALTPFLLRYLGGKVAFWTKPKKADPLERIASSLEALANLYALDLHSRGVSTSTGQEVGEVLLTDEEELAAKELHDELRKLYGLPEHHDFTVPGPAVPGGDGSGKAGTWPTQEVSPSAGGEGPPPLFGASWGFGLGPEGAESVEPGIDPAWIERLGPPSSPFGPYNSKKQEGEGGADSGEEPERGAE